MMAASLHISVKIPIKSNQFHSKPRNIHPSFRLATIRCSVAAPTKRYSITLLPGDGIGPEVISVAKNALQLAGSLEGTQNFLFEKKRTEEENPNTQHKLKMVVTDAATRLSIPPLFLCS